MPKCLFQSKNKKSPRSVIRQRANPPLFRQNAN
nr:MAG TPA: hypothetical protein [Caudoviricetes sp.]